MTTKRVCSLMLALLMMITPARAAEMNAVPGQVQYAGRIFTTFTTEDTEGTEVRAGVRGVTFALFREQSGGAALWVETQNVSVAAGGAYSALLGAATSGGIPRDIFSSGEARWLEVSYTAASGQIITQPRVLLVSVPYALKAGDAQTLGGLPAAAFVLNAAALTKRVDEAGGVAALADVLPSAAISGTGTTNRITK